MRRRWRCLAVMLLSASAMAGAAPAGSAACPTQPPAAEPAGIADGYLGCNPLGKYYDALRSARPDWQAVHRCAAQDRNDAVLMMLYANGYGVPRDVDRAIGHACRVDGAPAELAGRIEHLQRMKAGAPEPGRKGFDLCDDVTSGMMMGLCARIAEDAGARARDAALAGLAASFSAVQQARYATLRQATGAFAQSVGEHETDLSGTARGAMVVGAQAAVLDTLLADLRAAEGGTPPRGTDAAFAAADKALNDAYRKVMALPADGEGRLARTTVTKRDIRLTQRAWIAYRDAWTAFARARYPSVGAAAWKARLTERRTAQLRDWLD